VKKFTKFQMLLFQPGEPAPTHGKAMPERSFAASSKLVTLLNVSKNVLFILEGLVAQKGIRPIRR
jgi:hypothetical protein